MADTLQQLQDLQKRLDVPAVEAAGRFFYTHNNAGPSVGDLAHHLNNGLVPIVGQIDLAILSAQQGQAIPQQCRQGLEQGVIALPARIRDPLAETRSNINQLFPDPAVRAEADQHLAAVEQYRDMLRNRQADILQGIRNAFSAGPSSPPPPPRP